MEKIAIITPCFNENITAVKFLESLNNVLAEINFYFEIIIIDDASHDNTLQLLKEYNFTAPNITKHILSLQFNCGHQGAIYQGFLYARELDCHRFIVMDSDGEDNPSAIIELLSKDAEIVTVVRGKRRESISFKLGYFVYRKFFYFITGKSMNFGNYSIISRNILENAIHNNFIHFPAFLLKQKAHKAEIIFDRAKRIDGKSKMNYQSLIQHAFKSLVENAEDLLMFFFKIFVIVIFIFLISIGNVFYQKFISNTAISGWASNVLIGLFNMALLSFGIFVLGLLLLNLFKQKTKNSPIKIYKLYK